MTLVPTGALERWRTRARRGALSKLHSLLEFRDLVKSEGYREEGVLMQAQKEAAEAMMISPETLRDDMGKIREYPEEKLIYWITNGVCFDHLEKSAAVAELAGRTPAELLDEAIEIGNEKGKTMTVNEMVAHALGVVEKPKRQSVTFFVPLLERLGKFPSRFHWDNEKTNRYNNWLEQGKVFFK